VRKPCWLDLDVHGRTVFAVVYLLAQAGLVTTSALRPDRVFSFQMFNESSTISIRLSRRVLGDHGAMVAVPTNGGWEARDENGVRRWFSWGDRVRDPILSTLGRPVHASYGVDAQLFRLERALDDVAGKLVHDRETRALIADVEVRRNGRDPTFCHFESVISRP
jgi:hypothetical protein